jgi:hypothetical protein
MSAAPIPAVVAFLICEKIIAEAETKKKTLVNVFDRILSSQFPATFGPFCIYVRMVDAEGDYSIRVEFVHLETEMQVARTDAVTLNVPRRLGTHDLTFIIPGVELHSPRNV